MTVVVSFQMKMDGVGSRTRHSCRISYRCGPARPSTLEMQIRSTALAACLELESLLQVPKKLENVFLSLETCLELRNRMGFGLRFLR